MTVRCDEVRGPLGPAARVGVARCRLRPAPLRLERAVAMAGGVPLALRRAFDVGKRGRVPHLSSGVFVAHGIATCCDAHKRRAHP